MKIPEPVVLAWEAVMFMLGLGSLFAWAIWQDGSAMVLRRVGFVQLAAERQALANRTFKDIMSYDLQD